MMKKLFNKKIAKLYIVLICVMFVFTVTASGFSIHYSSQYTTLVEESSSSGSLTDSISSVLGALVGAQSGSSEDTENATDAISSAISSVLGGEEEGEEVNSEELKAAQSKKIASTVIAVVFAILLVAASAGTITCYQYEKYLESPKYKAKLKRMQKLEKIKANQQ